MEVTKRASQQEKKVKERAGEAKRIQDLERQVRNELQRSTLYNLLNRGRQLFLSAGVHLSSFFYALQILSHTPSVLLSFLSLPGVIKFSCSLFTFCNTALHAFKIYSAVCCSTLWCIAHCMLQLKNP